MNTNKKCFNKKIHVNGIKLSFELVQINLLHASHPEHSRLLFFQRVSQNQINMPFVLLTGMEEKIRVSCCVDAGDINRIKKMVALEPNLRETVEFISSVGALTLFPHRSNLKLMGLALFLFGREQIPMHGIASSISALTFITDFPILDNAVSIFLKYVDLPPNHAPFRPETQVIQKKR